MVGKEKNDEKHFNRLRMAVLGFLLLNTLVKGTVPAAGGNDAWRSVAPMPTVRDDLAATESKVTKKRPMIPNVVEVL